MMFFWRQGRPTLVDIFSKILDGTVRLSPGSQQYASLVSVLVFEGSRPS